MLHETYPLVFIVKPMRDSQGRDGSQWYSFRSRWPFIQPHQNVMDRCNYYESPNQCQRQRGFHRKLTGANSELFIVIGATFSEIRQQTVSFLMFRWKPRYCWRWFGEHNLLRLYKWPATTRCKPVRAVISSRIPHRLHNEN
jgi:hypothetical protein